MVQAVPEARLEDWACDLFNATGVIDALFGVGLNRPVDDLLSRWIEAINRRKGKGVLAIDMPSGVCSRSGQILGAAIQAERTVTLAVGKPGLYLSPGKFQAGVVSITDIGIPEGILKQFPTELCLTTPDWVKHHAPKPLPASHKGNRGHVMVIGGSRAMSGAPQLSAIAALTTGCGLVTLAMPEVAYDTTATLWPELMHAPWSDSDLKQASHHLIEAVSERPPHAIVLGPGLGADTEQLIAELIPMLLRASEAPLILDADALNALAKLSFPPRLADHVILTPHIGEAARLLHTSSAELLVNLPEAARQLQTQWGGVIVLKSATTVIALPSGAIVINPTGSPVLATAGSGDVLAGMIASFAAQGHSVKNAALMGVYMHGLSGEIASEKAQGHGVRAMQLIENIANTFLKLTS
jgi:NAD(P)H-hydrate epimerase